MASAKRDYFLLQNGKVYTKEDKVLGIDKQDIRELITCNGAAVKIISISGKYDHMLALTDDGRIFAIGDVCLFFWFIFF